MSKKTTPHPSESSRDDVLALLLKAAGSRQPPPQADYEQVLGAATEALNQRLRRRRRRTYAALAAGIASVAILAASLLPGRQTGMPGAAFAATDVVVGTAMIQAAGDADWSWLDAAQTASLGRGTRLRTGPASAVGLRLERGGSLRIDARTEVELQPDGRVVLTAGAVYFDSGSRDGNTDTLEIVTPDSRVRHLGTQFEVRHSKPGSRVRVREGRVLISTRLRDFESEAGEELTILAQGSVQRASIAPDDPGWDWVQTVAPTVYAEDQPLSELLDWVARETGRRVYFARPELELRAQRTILHGSPRRLMPMEALGVMMQTTDFHYLVTGGNEILVDAGSP